MRIAEARVSRLGAALFMIVVASFSAVGAGAPGVWRSGGPYGGSAKTLVLDRAAPSTLYVGTAGGVFRSTDSGITWAARSAGMGVVPVLGLTIDPTASSTLYAATSEAGIFRSTDSGETWIHASKGLASGSVDTVAVDPSRPSTLYAGTLLGVFKSTDSGGTWTDTGLFLTSAPHVSVLSIDPTVPTTVYAGTYGYGAFRSTNSGGTWKPCASLATTRPGPVAVYALQPDPTDPSTLYAGTDYGIRRSTDSGTSWGPPGRGLSGTPRSLALDPSWTGIVYVGTTDGVFRSIDSGATWTTAGAGLVGYVNRWVNALVIDPSNRATLHIATYGGPFRSTDSGGSWAPSSAGLTNLSVSSLTVSRAAPGVVYAGASDARIFRSTDLGDTWALSNEGIPTAFTGYVPSQVYAIAVDPSNPATLYAGIAGVYDFSADDGVFKSTDSGRSWAHAGVGLGYASARALAIDPSVPSTVYAGTPDGVFRSTDSGGTWRSSSVGLRSLMVRVLALDPSTPSTLYAGTDSGLFRSADSAGTWVSVNEGLSSPYSTPSIRALAVALSGPSILYVATTRDLFRSTDSGGSWTPASTGLATFPVNALVISSDIPSTLYAGSDGGVFESTDSGDTWAPVDADLPYRAARALVLDPTGTTTLFAGFEVGSVWQATPPPEGASTKTLLLPSSARGPGQGGAYYTTDLTVANTGETPTTFTLEFLDHDVDGRDGPERSFAIGAGASTTLPDVLGSVFGLTTAFGAIRITSPSSALRALSQTSTPAFGGTVGQSVPAARLEDLVTGGVPRSILGVREDRLFRTNLILASATDGPLDVDVALVADDGAELGSRRFTLPPVGMTQVSHVVRALRVTADVSGARLVVSTPAAGKLFAAYASAIDNATNDPRTLLPIAPVASGSTWAGQLVPSSARTGGAGGAFYTTDLSIAYRGDFSARYVLKFLGHDRDGNTGPELTFELGPQRSVTYRDVLGSVFHATSDHGAIRITPTYTRDLAVLAETATPAFGGTVGQSVPASTGTDLIHFGSRRSILAIREDDAFRSNLILANATQTALEVDVRLISAEGEALATKRYSLAPLGMTQVTRVVRDLGIAHSLAGARLELSTPTPAGIFAAYASAIDDVTNDPRTLLPR